ATSIRQGTVTASLIVIVGKLDRLARSLRQLVDTTVPLGGRGVVNTASGAGLVGVAQLSAYNVSKQGVVGLTKTARLEFAQKKIRVNCVCPGLINTPMVARMIDSGGMHEQ